MAKANILVQLDADAQPSVFDSVVAVDAGVAQLFRHGGVAPQDVRGLVHGALFTRGFDDLKHTAVFVGGSNVAAGEALLDEVRKACFGPFRVSAMLDSGGANTTAAAAVLVAGKHLDLKGAKATVLAASGPVGSRVVRLLARAGAEVVVASRDAARAEAVCEAVRKRVPEAKLTAAATPDAAGTQAALEGSALVVGAGAAGVSLLPKSLWHAHSSLKVAIDLNAVPPAGIEGIDVADKAVEKGGVVGYGAVGVGGTKMKIHRAAIQRLFETNDAVLDAEEIYELGRSLIK
ncbi:MAG: NAD(P)-dependent methylenetetrahydromethanopterin dehydrogenase [Pirellulales bacterium]